ncbi:VIT family protein [Streptococcus sp. E29BA]|uniref:VIT1/CCC1 transporter family protein n=1 Tax=Streptococcus sp. E29BA TaxID=3278716 RepID=UPI00359F086E
MSEQFSSKLNILRAGVLGANNGIVFIVGVVIGVASATTDQWVIFLSGMSAVLAGAFSMAGGEYVSVPTQKDTEQAATEKERRLYTEHPDAARLSLKAIYMARGECETAAEFMVNKAFAKNPVKTLVEEKYNMDFEAFTNPWHAALSSFLAFVAGAVFPMLAVMLFPVSIRIPATVLVVILSLFVTGYTSARLGEAPIVPAVGRNIMVGLLTIFVTFVIGHLLVTGVVG